MLNGKIEQRTFFRKCFKLSDPRFSDRAFFIFEYKMMTSDHHAFSFDRGGNSMCNNIIDLAVHLFMLQPSFSGGFHNSLCHGMWKMFLQTGRHSQQLILTLLTERNHLSYRRSRLCECPRLIEHDRCGICSSFHIFSAFYGNIMCARLPDRRQYRNWNRQLECTRKIYHQYCQCLGHISCQQPGQNRSCQCIRNQLICQMFCMTFQI